MWMLPREMLQPTADKTLIDYAFEFWFRGERNIARACIVDYLRDCDMDAFVKTITQRQPPGFTADMLVIADEPDGATVVQVQPMRIRA